MTKERLNEILGLLLEKDESVETTSLLEEIRKGFEPDKELADLKQKYKDLEQNYINTFKSNITNQQEDNSPPKPKNEEVELPKETETKFEDIFKE